MNKNNRAFLFPLGRTFATPAVLRALERAGAHPFALLVRHQCGDWGVLDAEDRAVNDRAVINGTRILSAYVIGNEKIYVITEADRSNTTVLLASEY
ncbi:MULTISPECIES: hypothetical protein [Paraburkholderia]|uniref:hypothetical protein n=1 Tax=Paraburkholderia TaxID=1822464 RepID=UPI002254331D|nr:MULTISPECIES: hypothetical protein [Paraburkholderia]MCX4166318.1 hypothetical protein [Paraburkholderia megapolitana]MDN7161808.1 hypothetical protein [Paraburkholderia sp. CHISQ3]MDQ6498856.1 hypothetical protein [Paraburkholderia megapolitana]